MLLSKRHLIIGLAVCAILHVACLRTRHLTPAHSAVVIAAAGSFQPDGWYPGEPFAGAKGVRAWGSWSGADENMGTLAIGPFPAPRILRFGLSGYPTNPGNRLEVELVGTPERRVVEHEPVGERWRVVDFELPAQWAGQPIRLLATDSARGLGGWLAVSEPIRGGRGDGNNGLLESFAAWSINGLLLALLFSTGARWLLAQELLPPCWIPLGAGAWVAIAGYVAFWAYFANALLGTVFSWTVLAVALVLTLTDRRPPASPAGSAATAEITTVVRLCFIIGGFYLALLHLFPSSHDYYTLAANRFRDSLPGDNTIPHAFAERLFGSAPVKNLADEWLSSDRPPLQSGWQLLTWPASKALGLDRRSASGTSAVWFQLLWVAAAYGLLRTFRLSPARAAGWVAVLALGGFFLQNTTYTWPKLSAGAFACGAFAALVLPGPGTRPRVNAAWAALFGGLAWLSHGGVAFSFLALLPWIGWRVARGEWRAWRPAVVLFAGLVLPWFAYQRFYDPPANRLLKWHLGGQADLDPRGTWETIRANYQKAGWHEAWANKAANFHGQIFGDWRRLVDVSAETRVGRRDHEFFHTLRALTWWPVLAVLAVVLTRRSRINEVRDLATLGGWLLLTIVIWCLLMFGAYQAAIHQGSYAMMIGLFVFFSVLLERTGRGWLVAVAGLQAITLGTTWAVANPAIHGPATGLPVVIVATAGLAWFVYRAFAGSALVAGPSIDPHDLHVGLPASGSPAPESGAWIRFAKSFLTWWREPRLNLWVLVALAALMFLRKPHTLLAPQLWAEDGSIFLNEQDQLGLRAFVTPYAGYLHTLPRIIAWLSAHLFDPAWWPAFYNGTAFVIWVVVLARLFSPRFAFPGKPWLALAFLFVPHTGEVLFNVTNLQWLTAFVLIQQALIAPPVTRCTRVGDLLILLVVSLTGPFAIAFLPLFVWRWWRTRSRDNALAFGVVAAGAVLQAWFIVRTGPVYDFQGTAFQFWPNLVVLARRLVIWPVFGHDLALALPAAAVGVLGALLLGTVIVRALRPHPDRWYRSQILAAFGLILIAGIYRTRPDTWPADNLDFAERYFYVPRVLLAWLLIWEFDAASRAVANVARVFCLAIFVVHFGNYKIPSPINYHWADHCDPVRRGVPAQIAILPEGWTLEYRGRGGSK